MSEALDAMVKAMIAEMRTQRGRTGSGVWVDDEFGPEDVVIDGSVDLEKVARAALAAIRPAGPLERDDFRKGDFAEMALRAAIDAILK